jgi:ribonuclease E
MFSRFGVEKELARLGEHEVPLPGGGRLVIESVEALVSILVKAGEQRPTQNLELRTNLEAATEIARQLRLRNLGGIIVVQVLHTGQRASERAVERRPCAWLVTSIRMRDSG